jgi:hypothetical protein
MVFSNNRISSACSIFYRRIEPLENSADVEEDQPNSFTDTEDAYIRKTDSSRKRVVATDSPRAKRQRMGLRDEPASRLPSLKDEICMFRRVRLMLCSQGSIAESQIDAQVHKDGFTPPDKPRLIKVNT